MITSSHAETLHDAYTGRKKLILFEGDHNSTRPSEVLIASFLWLENELEWRSGLDSAEEDSEQKVANEYAMGSVDRVDSVRGSDIQVGSVDGRTR